MQREFPVIKDLVLVGGGHAHALVARMWAMDPLAGVRLTLINPAPVAPYTGMLPGLIAGHYSRDEIMIDLVRLARFAGARVILDRCVGIDPAARQVILAGRPPISYDVVSVDIGISSDLPEVRGLRRPCCRGQAFGRLCRAVGGFRRPQSGAAARRGDRRGRRRGGAGAGQPAPPGRAGQGIRWCSVQRPRCR